MIKLIEMYPMYLDNKTTRAILEACDFQIESLEQSIEELVKEFNIKTSTEMLPIWAEFVGIDDNSTLDIETRRSNILASLKVQEITTVEVIKKIAESYSHGECRIIEIPEEYKFQIKFTGTKGIPSRLDEIKKTIRKVAPAHLDFEFIFTYMTWDEMEAYNLNWNQWDAKNLTWDEFEKYGK